MLIEHACLKLQAQYGVFADRGDVEGFTGLFAPDGSVEVPEAPAFVGHDAIRRWKTEYSGKFGPTTTEPFFISTESGKTQVTAHVTGDFPGSPVDLRYFFVIAGDKVAELEITV